MIAFGCEITKESRRKHKDDKCKEGKKTRRAARNLIKGTKVWLTEKSDDIKEEVYDDRHDYRAGRIHRKGEQNARKKINGEKLQVEMEQREEYRA